MKTPPLKLFAVLLALPAACTAYLMLTGDGRAMAALLVYAAILLVFTVMVWMLHAAITWRIYVLRSRLAKGTHVLIDGKVVPRG